jgi:hypothetical protein
MKSFFGGQLFLYCKISVHSITMMVSSALRLYWRLPSWSSSSLLAAAAAVTASSVSAFVYNDNDVDRQITTNNNNNNNTNKAPTSRRAATVAYCEQAPALPKTNLQRRVSTYAAQPFTTTSPCFLGMI